VEENLKPHLMLERSSDIQPQQVSFFISKGAISLFSGTDPPLLFQNALLLRLA